MNQDILNRLEKSKYNKLVNFIYQLLIDKHLHRIIPLSHIDVNDWECNLYPAVYIHNKSNMFKIRKYCRCSTFDILNAIKFYNK